MRLDAINAEVLESIFAHLLYHEMVLWTDSQGQFNIMPWKPHGHFGHCGQSCGCCRSHNRDDAGFDMNCDPCYAGWILTQVSQRVLAATKSYARRTYGCQCDEPLCRTWSKRGWVCPVIWPSPLSYNLSHAKRLLECRRRALQA